MARNEHGQSSDCTSSVSRRDVLAGLAGLTAAESGLRLGGAEAAAPVESDQSEIRLREIYQIAFIVRDIEREAKRWADLLGMDVPEIIITDTEDKAHTRFRGAPTPARAKLAFFSFGSISLELIEPVGGPSTWKEVLDKHGEGLHHIAFRVEEIDKILAFLNKKGFTTIQTGDFETGRYTYVDTTPVLKTMIELLEFRSS